MRLFVLLSTFLSLTAAAQSLFEQRITQHREQHKAKILMGKTTPVPIRINQPEVEKVSEYRAAMQEK